MMEVFLCLTCIFLPTHAYVHNQLHYLLMCLLVYLCYFFKINIIRCECVYVLRT